jgi:SAM-dependent methyltransferase
VREIHPAAAVGFARAAEVYERARPSYPADAVAWLAVRCRLGPGRTVVDLGAGTGKLTRLLPATGARVIAVEPIAEMRALIEEVEALDGTAEAIPLADGAADAVVVAQAFHWFDHARALPELHRVLAPDGRLGLIWNSRDLEDPLQVELEEVLRPYRRRVTDQQSGAWRAPLQASPLFGPLEQGSFPYAQSFTADDLCERVASTSFVAAAAPDEREELLARVRSLTVGLEEPFPFRYRTDVYVVPRSRGQGAGGRGTSIQG